MGGLGKKKRVVGWEKKRGWVGEEKGLGGKEKGLGGEEKGLGWGEGNAQLFFWLFKRIGSENETIPNIISKQKK